ncbi:PREDICTED: uncharacterized protein LOC109177943 isoform X2 [Ipomoea nil]|nr:PREDICTED: uncharacterized protein LOC109177943 isoform X2 [Ipomoea nil]
MPAISIPGATLPTHSNYFSGVQGALQQNTHIGFIGNGAIQQSLPLTSHWSLGAGDKFGSQPADHYGVHPASRWPLVGNNISGVPYADQANQLLAVPKGWRHGDWICKCGFHNYSSRAQCKRCNASMPPASSSSFGSPAVTALGTKRLASEELHDLENKRLNAGHTFGLQPSYPGLQSIGSSGGSQVSGMYSTFGSGNPMVLPNLQANLQILPAAPTLLGKGAKQWRDGDWMCTNCNNHNYASRSHCNRCKTQRDTITQPVSVA